MLYCYQLRTFIFLLHVIHKWLFIGQSKNRISEFYKRHHYVTTSNVKTSGRPYVIAMKNNSIKFREKTRRITSYSCLFVVNLEHTCDITNSFATHKTHLTIGMK